MKNSIVPLHRYSSHRDDMTDRTNMVALLQKNNLGTSRSNPHMKLVYTNSMWYYFILPFSYKIFGHLVSIKCSPLLFIVISQSTFLYCCTNTLWCHLYLLIDVDTSIFQYLNVSNHIKEIFLSKRQTKESVSIFCFERIIV